MISGYAHVRLADGQWTIASDIVENKIVDLSVGGLPVKAVEWIKCEQLQETITINLSNGLNFRCTNDQQLLTLVGFKKTKMLKNSVLPLCSHWYQQSDKLSPGPVLDQLNFTYITYIMAPFILNQTPPMPYIFKIGNVFNSENEKISSMDITRSLLNFGIICNIIDKETLGFTARPLYVMSLVLDIKPPLFLTWEREALSEIWLSASTDVETIITLGSNLLKPLIDLVADLEGCTFTQNIRLILSLLIKSQRGGMTFGERDLLLNNLEIIIHLLQKDKKTLDTFIEFLGNQFIGIKDITRGRNKEIVYGIKTEEYDAFNVEGITVKAEE